MITPTQQRDIAEFYWANTVVLSSMAEFLARAVEQVAETSTMVGEMVANCGRQADAISATCKQVAVTVEHARTPE